MARSAFGLACTGVAAGAGSAQATSHDWVCLAYPKRLGNRLNGSAQGIRAATDHWSVIAYGEATARSSASATPSRIKLRLALPH